MLCASLPAPMPAVGITQGVIDVGHARSILFRQVSQRPVAIRLGSLQVVLEARDEAAKCGDLRQLPAHILACSQAQDSVQRHQRSGHRHRARR